MVLKHADALLLVIFRVLLDYLLDLQFHVGGAVDRFAGVLGKLLHGDHLLRFLLFAQPYDCDAALSQDLHFLVALWTAVPVRFLLIVAQYYLLFRQ